MARSSDGKSREKPSKHTSHDRNAIARASTKPGIEHLRPASPPKTNPWTTRRPTTTLSADWPCITPDFARTNVQDRGKDAVPAKHEAATTSDQDSSQTSAGKGPDAHPTSQEGLQGLTPRPGKSLWLRPFGADVFVRVGDQTFEVHRSIVEPQSTFFQHRLPPRRDLTPWGHEPIDVQLDLAPDAVGNALRFMYTKTVESCEYDRETPRNWTHIPRSVLLYIAAMDLGVEALKAEILRILQQTVTDMASYFQAGRLAHAMDDQGVVEGVFHLHNALEAAYSSGHVLDMLSLRLVLCRLLDTLLPFLIQQPVTAALFSSRVWEKYAAAISEDLLAARNLGDEAAAG
ncbi:hypothetical protein E4U42_006349 [Claviceps africana]|uniref:BTB domain-containing protein n=1 Tax=Claviceps africana TaxID=83212 RepID=A0A8K0NGU7_9HYPO|nr:hypothetical protein E4U42_006349 [Claviceps africana]